MFLTTTRLRIWSIMNRVSTGTDNNDRDESTQSGDAKYPNERGTTLTKEISISREIVRTLSFTHSTKFTIINYYFMYKRILCPNRSRPFPYRDTIGVSRDSACKARFISSILLAPYMRLTHAPNLHCAACITSYGATWIKLLLTNVPNLYFSLATS